MEEKELNIHSTILSTKVHDCKNMLGACLLQVESIIEEDSSNTELIELSSMLHSLNNEISDILFHHQLYAGRFTLNISENYIKDTIDEQISNSIKIKNRKDIEFHVECYEGLEWGYDEIIIGAVLRNILLNAIHYASKNIIITVAKEDSAINIKITDDGPGVNADGAKKGIGLRLIKDLIAIHSKAIETNIFFDSVADSGLEAILVIKKHK